MQQMIYFLSFIMLTAEYVESTNIDDDGVEQTETIIETPWTGPGIYGGIWIDSEADYWAWHDEYYKNTPYARENQQQREDDRQDYRQSGPDAGNRDFDRQGASRGSGAGRR